MKQPLNEGDTWTPTRGKAHKRIITSTADQSHIVYQDEDNLIGSCRALTFCDWITHTAAERTPASV